MVEAAECAEVFDDGFFAGGLEELTPGAADPVLVGIISTYCAIADDPGGPSASAADGRNSATARAAPAMCTVLFRMARANSSVVHWARSRIEGAWSADQLFLTLLVAVVVFAIAYDDGSYGLASRSAIGVVIWWSVVVGVGLGVWPRFALPSRVTTPGALLAGFALFTACSLIWAADRETAFQEFDRATLYLGVYMVVCMVASRRGLGAMLDGAWLGGSAIAVVAAASRLFPTLFPGRGLSTYLPSATRRLSFPLGYWNGLAIFVAMLLPLCIHGAISWRSRTLRAAAVAMFPVVGLDIYLASSRGGAIVALAGFVTMLVCSAGARWRVLGVTCLGSLGASTTIAYAGSKSAFTNAVGTVASLSSTGHRVCIVLLVAALATASIFSLLDHRTPRPSNWFGQSLVGLACMTIVFLLVLGHLGRRLHAFEAPPAATIGNGNDFVQAHLLSGNGSGRWQFWEAAVNQWQAHLIQGGGAGSYQQWWLAHGSISYFVRDAHSLYLQVLGELGLVGFVLIVGFVLGAVCGGAVALRRVHQMSDRVALGSAVAVGVSWAVGAAIDWTWQLPSVTIVGVAALAVAAFGCPVPSSVHERRAARARRALAATVATIAVAWIMVLSNALPWIVDMQLQSSRSAAAQGDLAGAAKSALAAKAIEPWGWSGYLQLALVSESAGDLRAARGWLAHALARDRLDWRLWLIAARLDTKSGSVASAKAALRRAESLNPRSPLFANLGS